MFSLFSEYRVAQKVAGQKFHLIFYAESGFYFQYYQHLFESLVSIPSIRILYITSDKNDAVLQDRRVTAVYLKSTLAGIFPHLQADVMILTMPDLQNFIFKRSPAVKKYVYVFHALVSTHQQYRAHAFDHYDAIFCTGPQQEREIREAERIDNLPQKQCITYGYPLLEALKEKCRTTTVQENKILLAPSWYTDGLLNTCVLPLVEELSKENWQLWIRPHPEFVKRNANVYAQLIKKLKKSSTIQFDNAPSVYTHLADSAHLITDRSGIGIEFALAALRPVLFIDTPLKIQNPHVAKIPIEPLENAFRKNLGDAVNPGELHWVNEVLQKQKRSVVHYRTFLEQVEKEIVFPPENWQNGIVYIRDQLNL